MRRAEVSSKTHTYLPKISSATPLTLPGSSLTASRNFGAGRVTEPIAKNITAARPKHRTMPAAFCPRIVSMSESDESTPTSMRTKRKNIITAPV
jgi:hypothetical protein